MHRRLSAIRILLLFAPACGFGQSADQKFGGLYDRLLPQQQRLVQDWAAEYQKVTGTVLNPEAGYNSLPLSTRTTFEAVTHALHKSPMTAEDGSPLGTALDLVQLVEGANGQIPNARGDQQFRLYVLLKPDALDKLYRSREYKRIGDNTIYHIGYPINFRQQGGTPSIQVSVTRTGRRADIDVDYRSSSKAKALFNGHLTSANSDVRAGDNYQSHIRRWDGFANWWQDFLGLFKDGVTPPTSVALKVNIPEHPKVPDTAPVTEAVLDFYKTWLVDGKPEEAMAYFSVRSYACLAEFQTGETIESGLAGLRILQHMRQALVAYGKSDSLADVLQAVPMYAPGAKPIPHPDGTLFSLEQLTPQAARAMDCRSRLKLKLAEEIPASGPGSGEYLATITRMKKEIGYVVVSQLWSKEQGFWKIVTWHFEQPFRSSASPRVAEPESANTHRLSSVRVDPGITEATEKFHRLWLVDRNYAEAAAFFAPESSTCSVLREGNTTAGFLSLIGSSLSRAVKLTELIETVPHAHDHMEEAPHPSAQAFLLARVSDDLGSMTKCGSGTPNRNATSANPQFTKGYYQTAFRFKDATGNGGALLLQWERVKGRWRIVAIEVPEV